MTILAAIPPFTVLQDTRTDLISGWLILYQTNVNMLAGDDVLLGSGAELGVGVGGVLDTNQGHDSIEGSGVNGIYASGTILSGLGNDTLIGNGRSCGIWINNGTLNCGAGNDSITGTVVMPASATGLLIGVWNSNGTIDAGAGDDVLSGSSSRAGTGIYNGSFITSGQSGVIKMGAGIDIIRGSGGIGVFSVGLIDTGDGGDQIIGDALGSGVGIYSEVAGSIVMGGGNDTLSGSGGGTGIRLNMSTLDTGIGNDVIVGVGSISGVEITTSTITGGLGADKLMGTGDSVGIYNNTGVIDMGAGNDLVLGSGVISGITNYGRILGGLGADTVDVFNGGLAGNGIIDLGPDGDTFRGFGSGYVMGGTGLDKIVLPDGTYQISSSVGTILSRGITMNVSGFERIGGATSGLFTFASGTVTVVSGVASFAA